MHIGWIQYVGFVHSNQRWASDRDRRLYTWDSLHGEIEVFNSRGKHLGVLHVVTGTWIGEAVPGEALMSNCSESFVSLVLTGNATAGEIDDYVDRWHNEPCDLQPA